VSYEIIKERIGYNENGNAEYIPFLKWNCIDPKKLNDFKNEINASKQYSIHDISNITKISGLIEDNNKLQEMVNSLIPYSFILYAKIKLTAPYFSKDDDEFYLIRNPCLKEKIFKVPMIRGSGWKGVIAKAGKELVNEDFKYFESYLRIFGTGSQEFRNLENMIDECVNKSKDLSFDKLISYLLFEMGFKLERNDIDDLKNEGKRAEWIKSKLWKKLEKGSKEKIPIFLQTHKGRAIFYPTYFDKLSLEIINPHSRKTRAGTNPIHYEVVPKGRTGILQIVYIPFDGVLTKDNDLKEEIKKDIEFLTRAIEIAADIGIGAKEKLGWGRFGLEDRKIICNKGDV